MNDKELYDSVLEEMDALDVEEACLGAIMAATGQNTVLVHRFLRYRCADFFQ